MTFRWGIVGTGYVARKFVLGLRQSGGGTAQGVHSRTRANAASFARGLGIPHVMDSVAELAGRADIDAIYIATPPTAHLAQALDCIAAGKPVLIEKPIAASAAEARQIAEAARAAGVFCMEGLWTRFMPLTTKLAETVANGRLGEIRSFEGSFGSAEIPDPKRNLFNPALGGGALLHRGLYPLSMALHLFGPVSQIETMARIGDTGVDEESQLLLRHDSGTISFIAASLRTRLPNDMRLAGTSGSIHVDTPVYRPFRLRRTKTRPGKGESTKVPRFSALREGDLVQGLQQRLYGLVGMLRGTRGRAEPAWYAGNGYGYEAAEVARCVAEGLTESPRMPLSDSIAALAVIDTARASWAASN